MIMSSDRFVNPYTFIPLKRKSQLFPNTRNAEYDVISGVILCELTTATECAIPDTGEPAQDGWTRFFRIGDTLAIPGSSIRGVVRSVYEVLTNSCMRVNDAPFHSSSSIKRPGLLACENGVYKLYTAERYRIKKDWIAKECGPTGSTVRFSWEYGKSKQATKIACSVNGRDDRSKGFFLHVNILETGKPNHPSIFENKGLEDDDVEAKYVESLGENIRMYIKNNSDEDGRSESKEASEYQRCFENMKLGKGMLPVWYNYQIDKRGNAVYQFAQAQMSRSVYPICPNDMLKREGLSPCDGSNNPCPACSLFGYVGKKSAASKVRFSDALCVNDRPATCVEWLPDLMEPRTSSFEFYLKNRESPNAFTPEESTCISTASHLSSLTY